MSSRADEVIRETLRRQSEATRRRAEEHREMIAAMVRSAEQEARQRRECTDALISGLFKKNKPEEAPDTPTLSCGNALV